MGTIFTLVGLGVVGFFAWRGVSPKTAPRLGGVRRRRGSGLGGDLDQHKREAGYHARQSLKVAKAARRSAETSDCTSAFSNLVGAVESLGAARAEADWIWTDWGHTEETRPRPRRDRQVMHEVDMAEEATGEAIGAFRRSCAAGDLRLGRRGGR